MNADRLNEIRQWLGAKPALSSAEAGSVRICRELLAALDAAEQRAADAREAAEQAEADWGLELQQAEARAAQAEAVSEGNKKLASDNMARKDVAEARVVQAEQERDEAAASWGSECRRGDAVEKERDEWQELAVRLAEEAGVDAEQMLAQARVAASPAEQS